jgi:hypothetical protein
MVRIAPPLVNKADAEVTEVMDGGEKLMVAAGEVAD